jgi:CysZ protein
VEGEKRMALFPNFRIGVRSYKDAHRFIVKHKLWLYVFLPAVFNIAIILLLILGGWHYFGLLTDWLFKTIGLSGEPEGYLRYLVIALQFVLRIVLQILLFFLYSAIYRYIILIILSPLLAMLSEKTEKLLTGKTYPFRFGHFCKDVLRGMGIAVRNFFLEFLFMIALFFFSYIPLIGYISPIVMFFITCYYYGFSMIDYTNERQRLNVRESVRFIRKNRGFAVASGMIFYVVFFFVPLIGFMVAPAYAVVAATLGTHNIRNQPEAVIIKNLGRKRRSN